MLHWNKPGDSKKRSDSTWCVRQKAKVKLVKKVWGQKLVELEEVGFLLSLDMKLFLLV